MCAIGRSNKLKTIMILLNIVALGDFQFDIKIGANHNQ